jgi:hypothetical protein
MFLPTEQKLLEPTAQKNKINGSDSFTTNNNRQMDYFQLLKCILFAAHCSLPKMVLVFMRQTEEEWQNVTVLYVISYLITNTKILVMNEILIFTCSAVNVDIYITFEGNMYTGHNKYTTIFSKIIIVKISLPYKYKTSNVLRLIISH